MNILFIHQNFPAQFQHLAPSLAKLGHKVKALTLNTDLTDNWNGIKVCRYELLKHNSYTVHPWARDFESKVIRAEYCARYALKLREGGYYPDLILAHPGWGETLFLTDIWPRATVKLYAEYFYNVADSDVDFDREFAKSDIVESAKVKLKNAHLYLSLETCHSAICPTEWQASTFPEPMRSKLTVIHDNGDNKINASFKKIISSDVNK